MLEPKSVHSDGAWVALCNSADLLEAGTAVSFDVRYQGLACRAFAVRYQGQAHAYLNRCSHVAMEIVFSIQPGVGWCARPMARCTSPTRANAEEDLVNAV
jgi:hypothetical protein